MNKVSIIIDVRQGQKKALENLLYSLIDSSGDIKDINVITDATFKDLNIPKAFLRILSINYVTSSWFSSTAKVRNYGANIAQTDNLVFLDSEVIASPNLIRNLKSDALERVVKIAYPMQLPFVPLKGNFIDLLTSADLCPMLVDQIAEESINSDYFCSLAFGISRDLLTELGGMRESEDAAEDEDMFFAEKLARHGIPLQLVSDLVIRSLSISETSGIPEVSAEEATSQVDKAVRKNVYHPVSQITPPKAQAECDAEKAMSA